MEFVDWLYVGGKRKRKVKGNFMVFGLNIWKNDIVFIEMVKS